MTYKATGERRRRRRGALIVLASLAAVLVVAAPALTQENTPVTGILTKPEITSYQYGTHVITDEATGVSYALESGSVDLDAYLGQRVTLHGAPVPGYQDGQIEGGPELLNVTGVDAPAEPSDPARASSPDGSSEGLYAPPGDVGGAAIQAAQAARQASDIAQTAEQSVQQAADTGDPLAASQAAEEAQQASGVARAAAKEAQQAAKQTEDPDIQAAAQEAQQAAEEAQEASGAAQTVAQVTERVAQQFDGIEETYAEALQAARSAGKGDNNVAFADEYGSEEAGANPDDAARTDNAGEGSGGEAAEGDTTDGKKTTGKKTAKDKDDGEAGSEEDTGGVGSNASSVAPPARGSVPLLLGGGVLLVAGVFVARKLIR